MRTTAVCGLVLSLLAGHCHRVQAQNLITNPDFDSDVSAWTTSPGATVVWDAAHNIVGQSGSGSLLITNELGSGSVADVSQCLAGPFTATMHDLGAWILIQPGSDLTGSARVAITFHASSICDGTPLDYRFVDLSGQTGTWFLETIPIDMSQGTFGSVRITLEARIFLGSSDALTAYFDGVRFGVAPTTPVELQRFIVD